MVLTVEEVVVVVATRYLLLFCVCMCGWAKLAQATILPEERSDAMYHRYDGGGVVIDGPSVLVRKNFKDSLSVSGNYYVDNVSSASIDVLTSGASEYSEKRTEYSVGVDYLYNKSIIGAGFTSSDESDYTAETFYFNVSQDFFGDLTNVTFGYSLGQDEVFQNGNSDFAEEIDRNNFRLDVSQIVSANMIMGFNYELISDEGYLNNPYRSYRYLSNPLDPEAGYQLAQEVYPNTRTSDAASLRLKYYLPWGAALGGSYRYFTDDWGIDAHTLQLAYTHVLYGSWFVDVKYRYYVQTQADFYSDLFLVSSQDEKDYRARDKELSDFNNHTFSAYLSYQRPLSYRSFDSAALSLQWDHIWFSYDNFTDLTDQAALAGEESLYEFDADVFKIVITLWY